MSEINNEVTAREFDFVSNEPFRLTSGAVLPRITQRYALYGDLSEHRDNAILVFHALTGSARVHEWWTDLIGAGRALDTNKFCIVCANYLGSCYGSTGASSINPATGKVFGDSFPLVTTRDIVRAQAELLEGLQITRLHAVVGGSVGGMLALQLAIDFPELAARAIAIGACELSAMGLGLNHLQRESIRQTKSVALARQIATLSYKSAEIFEVEHARRPNRNGENPGNSLRERFDIAGYLDYQADKFVERFDADSYNIITKAMDTFEIAAGYESELVALKRIKTAVTLVGISSDWLFPPEDVLELASRMQKANVDGEYIEMISRDGHDAFLSDTAKMNRILHSLIG